MKKLLIILGTTLLGARAFGQGSLVFAINWDNIIYFTTDSARLHPADVWKTFDSAADGGPFPIAGSSAFVGPCMDGTSPGSIQVLAGSPTFVAALYAGTKSTSLSLQTTTTIDSWADGNPGGIVAVVANMAAPIAAGVPAWFQVQVYDSRYPNAAAAWAVFGVYAGESPIFQATPLVVPDYLYATTPPVNSTWAPGTAPVLDLDVQAGAGSFFGGIALCVTRSLSQPPHIWTQPQSITRSWGQNATFSVTATGDPTPGYQWQAHGTNLYNGPHVSGSTSSQLSLSAITLADAGNYQVIVANPAGVITSSVATLTVVGSLSITDQPISQVCYWGKSATFSVTALGDPPPSYQWQKDGAPIPGETGTSLVLTNLRETNAGRYTVLVTNLFGSITSRNAYLTVNPPGVSLALYPGITIDGAAGLAYGIQYRTNLSARAGWQGMTNLTLDLPTELWFDLQPATQQQRYYQVVPGRIPVP